MVSRVGPMRLGDLTAPRVGQLYSEPLATVAAAMIDRLVHHAEVVRMKGDSYRLKDRDLGRVPNDDAA